MLSKIHQGRNTVFNRHKRTFLGNLVKDYKNNDSHNYTNSKKIPRVPNIRPKIRKHYPKYFIPIFISKNYNSILHPSSFMLHYFLDQHYFLDHIYFLDIVIDQRNCSINNDVTILYKFGQIIVWKPCFASKIFQKYYRRFPFTLRMFGSFK